MALQIRMCLAHVRRQYRKIAGIRGAKSNYSTPPQLFTCFEEYSYKIQCKDISNVQNTLSLSVTTHSFDHSYIISFLIFAQFLSTIGTFLKLEVQLHTSLHFKNSLLSLWLCHGFGNENHVVCGLG